MTYLELIRDSEFKLCRNLITLGEYGELVKPARREIIPEGKWIHPYKSDIACECSICHIQMPITKDYHYCPNCGADMRESEGAE